MIRKLGGNTTLSYECEREESERATHLIIDELKKTEKFLCAIASGLWVLHSSYLDQCRKEGKFLPVIFTPSQQEFVLCGLILTYCNLQEEGFEWGNPKNEKLTNISGETKLLACAAHRWRLIIRNGGPNKRPYVGMKVVIIGIDNVVHSLTKVVKSGGGKVLPTKYVFYSYDSLRTIPIILI